MPFNEALFWVGITVLGTGGYILWDRHLKSLLWSVLLIIAGLLAMGYSVYVHYHPTALGPSVWIMFLALTWAAIAWDVFDRRRLRHSRATSPAVPRPLSIISARWGIGGDAYKDVTDIVRKHARPDSINIPASIGLLGDPYPGVGKYLRVVYSFAKQWEVSVPEPGNLILPEKEGEEQGNLQRFQARLDNLMSPEDKLVNSLSESEQMLFMKLRSDFNLLPWCEKIALKRVCSAGIFPAKDIQAGLASDGFNNPSNLIEQLILKGFLERSHDGMLNPSVAKAKWIDVLFQGIKLC